MQCLNHGPTQQCPPQVELHLASFPRWHSLQLESLLTEQDSCSPYLPRVQLPPHPLRSRSHLSQPCGGAACAGRHSGTDHRCFHGKTFSCASCESHKRQERISLPYSPGPGLPVVLLLEHSSWPVPEPLQFPLRCCPPCERGHQPYCGHL